MKALILSGGKGTRLRPITFTTSKQLVPIANRPILFYAIDHMIAAGITDIGIVVGDTAAEVEAVVGNGSRWGARVTYIQQDAPLGLAHAVFIAHGFLGDDDFVMYLGDNLLRDGITPFVEKFTSARVSSSPSRPNAQILLAHVDDPHRFGIAELDNNGNVISLMEKPENPPSNLALVGAYLFDANVHEAVRAIEPSPRGELEITDAIQWLIDTGKTVCSDVVEGYWKDLGELDAILDGNSLMLEKQDFVVQGEIDEHSHVDQRVRIAQGATIENSTLRGPVVIGEGAKISGSYIGPFTSIGNYCEISGAEVEHSMVLDHARIIDCGRIEDSLIGQFASVVRTKRRPSASRLMIGDHSSVDPG